jgi:hypothetical protein
MLRDLQFEGTKEFMFFHGIRMMFHAKRSLVGVGGKTEAIALQNDGITHYFGTQVAQKTEDLVTNWEQFCNKILYMHIANVAAPEPSRDLKEIISMYRKCYEDILKPSDSQTSEDQR